MHDLELIGRKIECAALSGSSVPQTYAHIYLNRQKRVSTLRACVCVRDKGGGVELGAKHDVSEWRTID